MCACLFSSRSCWCHCIHYIKISAHVSCSCPLICESGDSCCGIQSSILEESGLSEVRHLSYMLCYTMTSALRHFDKHLCSQANTAHFSWLDLAIITLLQWISARVYVWLKKKLKLSTDQETFCPKPSLYLNQNASVCRLHTLHALCAYLRGACIQCWEGYF